MKRRLFTILAALSLLLLAATLLLWARSHMIADQFYFERPGRSSDATRNGAVPLSLTRAVIQTRGSILIAILTVYAAPPGAGVPHSEGVRHETSRPYRLLQPENLWHRIGLDAEHDDGSESTLTRVILPHWLLAALFALPPSLWIWTHRRRRQSDIAGRCPTCGYDLRATPDRCPECGSVPARKIS